MSKTVSSTIPVPISGISLEQARDVMNPLYCWDMMNCYPINGVIRRRPQMMESQSTIANDPRYLINYQNQQLLCQTLTGGPYNLNPGGAITLLPGTGSGTMPYTGFGGYIMMRTLASGNLLFLTNGAAEVCYYDGSNFNKAGFTFLGAAITNLQSPVVYKGRLFFAGYQDNKLYYAAFGFVTGALTSFPIHKLLIWGGNILWMGTWSGNSGYGMDDFLVVASTNGEILLFKGTDPSSASTWTFVSRFYVPRSTSFRCFTYRNADVVITTIEGVFYLSELVNIGQTAYEVNIAEEIKPIFHNFSPPSGYFPPGFAVKHIDSFEPVFLNRTHQLFLFSNGNLYMPETGEVLNLAEFEVMDILNKSWSRWEMPSQVLLNSLGVLTDPYPISAIEYQDTLYFIVYYIDGGGEKYKLFWYDGLYSTGDYDIWGGNNIPIPMQINCAFNYFNDRNHMKRFISAEPYATLKADTTGQLMGYANNRVDSRVNIYSQLAARSFKMEKLGSKKAFLDCWGKNLSVIMKIPQAAANTSISAFNIIYEEGGFD